jgi:methyl coenzyme M reductase subunit C
MYIKKTAVHRCARGKKKTHMAEGVCEVAYGLMHMANVRFRVLGLLTL